MKKNFIFTILLFVSVIVTSFSVLIGAAKAGDDGVFNPRDDLNYGYHGTEERLDKRQQQILMQQYQQQEYMDQQRRIYQQNLNSQIYQSGYESSSSMYSGR